jgi:chloramphenicol 3-O phosphotransferase
MYGITKSAPSMSSLIFSAMGNNVVVDSVIGNDQWFNTCIELFSDHPVIFVVVKCSKEELARREQLRGDRELD